MRLLVIEDYEPIRTAVTTGLTEAGFVVDSTGDGEEGLWFARDAVYDAIVLDLMLPKIDGLSILKKIRSEKNCTPVLVLTAKDKLDQRVAGLDAGADDYLVKPFAFRELLARIHALVRRHYNVARSALSIDDLHIDFNARQATRSGAPIALSAYEFSLLEALALNSGKVVSRSELSAHLYGFNSEPNSNAIDVRIAQLRRKLHAAGCSAQIQTRRGMGYVLGREVSCDQ
ncbi:MAG TPA: response regulator transcription factor [Tepidisphaeraceae bacterium]|nr:response regulator transcription factor [Tepidisphaeraceae bacterium]